MATQYTEKVDKAIYQCGLQSKQDFIDLAFAALDQAGLKRDGEALKYGEQPSWDKQTEQ